MDALTGAESWPAAAWTETPWRRRCHSPRSPQLNRSPGEPSASAPASESAVIQFKSALFIKIQKDILF